MRFAQPEFLYLLTIVPILIFFYVFQGRRRRDALRQLGKRNWWKGCRVQLKRADSLSKQVCLYSRWFALSSLLLARNSGPGPKL